ncbi:hypothetical protein TRFO_30230 [Tritrichomonas foetus]|uniref:3'-5' exonuclease domain-containing protein n=1 Tax=Tritrichomonas foetus TaxID=1144522 RepID=A0A1J4JV34_9EUKA|nr:hypothetical protein TRFO_30230 [Tritrichomonas foetus]|eukprot:OHT02570.1 hypothetical protein TRFO_30230 [Tritrichomonas foetus]
MDISVVRQVNCPVTNAPFFLVKNEQSPTYNEFNNWLTQLEQKLSNGKYVNLSIDCEGFMLGTTYPLGCVQMGEIFNDTYNPTKGGRPPAVNVEKGFILFSPSSNAIKERLTRIMNNDNTTLYTFDFTHDFGSMIADGYNLTLKHVIDAQVASSESSNYIENTRIRGLKWFIDQAASMDRFGRNASRYMSIDKGLYLDKIQFLNLDSPNRFDLMLSNDFLSMAAVDVYATGLACIFALSRNANSVIRKSAEKVREFFNWQRKCGSIMAASAKRQIAFFNQYRARDFQYVRTDASGPDDVKRLLEDWKSLYQIVESKKILRSSANVNLRNDVLERSFPLICQNLDKYRHIIETL